uniref:Uncharacterized protein n=1 Tax=Oryza meridionalis TaxID=40149 RepID=A0A0E0E0F3_9ORYZ
MHPHLVTSLSQAGRPLRGHAKAAACLSPAMRRQRPSSSRAAAPNSAWLLALLDPGAVAAPPSAITASASPLRIAAICGEHMCSVVY